MNAVVYEDGLLSQFQLTDQLSDDAVEYFQVHDHEDAIRYLIRYFLVPAHHASTPRVQAHTRMALQWYAHCASEEQRWDIIDQQGYGWPAGTPQPLSLFFEWWWEEVFGDAMPDAGGTCDQVEFRRGNPPDWDREDNYPRVTVDPDVVNFPRRDGKPPGYGAPAQLYDKAPLPPPMRPTDASRFLRWEDQAAAIDQAETIHAVTGQHKVWVQFPHVVGEGYLIGGEEYRETAWACVRFRGGGAVDSWPDLRKGWSPE